MGEEDERSEDREDGRSGGALPLRQESVSEAEQGQGSEPCSQACDIMLLNTNLLQLH